MQGNGYQQFQKSYRQVEVSTADPLQLVVLLYEGAIKNLNVASRLFDSDRATASARIGRTQEIVNYLRNSLDHRQGGDISGNLERLYEYMRDALNDATINRDSERVREVAGLLQMLLESWRAIAPSGTTDSSEQGARQSIDFAADETAATPKVGFSMMG